MPARACCHRAAGGLVHGQHVVAIHDLGGHAVSRAAVGHVCAGHLQFETASSKRTGCCCRRRPPAASARWPGSRPRASRRGWWRRRRNNRRRRRPCAPILQGQRHSRRHRHDAAMRADDGDNPRGSCRPCACCRRGRGSARRRGPCTARKCCRGGTPRIRNRRPDRGATGTAHRQARQQRVPTGMASCPRPTYTPPRILPCR